MKEYKADPKSPQGPGSKLNKKLLALFAVLSLSFALAACGSDSGSDDNSGSEPTANSNDPAVAALNEFFGAGGEEGGEGVTVNNGMLLAMTGEGSYFGRVMSQGSKLAASQIKAAGGPTFNTTISDHENGDIQAGVTATRRMITQDEISTLQTSYGAVSEAIIPLIQQAGVLTFNGGGPSPGQVGKDFLWNNRMLFGDAPAAGGLAWLAKHNPDAKRLAIVGTAENATNAIENLVPEIWPEVQSGGTIATTQIHSVGTTDFSSVVAKVRASNADAVWVGSFGNDVGYLVKDLRQGGFEGPIMAIEFTTDACKVAPKEMGTAFVSADYFDPNTQNPLGQAFVKSYRQEYGEDPDFFAANYYEQLLIVWDLVRRVIADGGDPTSGADLQEALIADPTFPSPYGGGKGEAGEITFDTERHTVSKPMTILDLNQQCKPKAVAEIKEVPEDADPNSALISDSAE